MCECVGEGGRYINNYERNLQKMDSPREKTFGRYYKGRLGEVACHLRVLFYDYCYHSVSLLAVFVFPNRMTLLFNISTLKIRHLVPSKALSIAV